MGRVDEHFVGHWDSLGGWPWPACRGPKGAREPTTTTHGGLNGCESDGPAGHVQAGRAPVQTAEAALRSCGPGSRRRLGA
jgi:hypothetical protein